IPRDDHERSRRLTAAGADFAIAVSDGVTASAYQRRRVRRARILGGELDDDGRQRHFANATTRSSLFVDQAAACSGLPPSAPGDGSRPTRGGFSLWSAALRTSLMSVTNTNSRSFFASAGTSSASRRFFSGKITRRMPARCAARTLALIPPTGSTRP